MQKTAQNECQSCQPLAEKSHYQQPSSFLHAHKNNLQLIFFLQRNYVWYAITVVLVGSFVAMTYIKYRKDQERQRLAAANQLNYSKSLEK